jgi:hypothetical protein
MKFSKTFGWTASVLMLTGAGILLWLEFSDWQPEGWVRPIQVPANNPFFRKAVTEWARTNKAGTPTTNRPVAFQSNAAPVAK